MCFVATFLAFILVILSQDRNKQKSYKKKCSPARCDALRNCGLCSISERSSIHTTASMNGHEPNVTERSSVLARMGTFGSVSGSYGTFGEYNSFSHSSGFRLFRQRWYAMFVKRVLHSKRHKAAIVSQLLLPLVYTLIALISAKTFPQPTDSPPLILSTDHFETNYVPWSVEK